MNAADLAKAMLACKTEIDASLRDCEVKIHEDASAERKFKIAWASAYLASSGTVGERDAHCEKATAYERYAAKMAEGLRRSAFQAVESKRQWLSALQSLASLSKSEAQLTRWEPRETESA